MKRITLILSMVAFCAVVFSQSLQEKRAVYFTDAAVKEFSLNADQRAELLKARMTYIADMGSVNKQAKNEEITEEVKAEKMKVVNQDMRTAFEKITGKPGKDLQPFYKKMSEELPNVK